MGANHLVGGPPALPRRVPDQALSAVRGRAQPQRRRSFVGAALLPAAGTRIATLGINRYHRPSGIGSTPSPLRALSAHRRHAVLPEAPPTGEGIPPPVALECAIAADTRLALRPRRSRDGIGRP